MRRSMSFALAVLLGAALWPTAARGAGKIKVVAASSVYADIAQRLGGDKVEVSFIVHGTQDPHTVRPKPSFALLLNKADLLLSTGLDLEVWLPSLQDAAGNRKIMSGQPGYVAVSTGMKLLEKPASLDRSEGDVHVFGNPHFHTSPLTGKVIAENITVGLKRVAPEHAALFDANLRRFKDEVDRRLFGPELIRLLGAKTLCRLAERGTLYEFLAARSFQGRPLLERLGGWMKAAQPLRGRKVVNYHKNWAYFAQVFGIKVVGYMEPKPGIPPSPGHIAALIERMKREQVRVIFDANYFDASKVQRVADKTGAVPVVVGFAPGAEPRMNSFFDQFDIWIRALNEGFARADAQAGRGG